MSLASDIRFAIPDLPTGCDIIARLPLATPGQACLDLQGILDSLYAKPPDAETYFRLLEQTRVPATYLAEELGKRYLNKSLPLGDVENTLFLSVTTTWQKLSRAYAHCAQVNYPAGQTPDTTRVATLLQRCIHYTGMVIIEHQLARREYPLDCWLDLHAYYASAEEWGLALHNVLDPIESPGRTTHCSATYVSILLCDMAGSYRLTVKEQQLVRRWALLWASLVKIILVAPDYPPTRFVLDLMQDHAVRPLSNFTIGPNLRALNTRRLEAQLVQVREQIQQRVPPTQLGLGDDRTAGQCLKMLGALARPWSQLPAIRKFRRHPGTGTVELCAGFDEMYYFIAGRAFEQPENVRTYSRAEFETLFAFRHQVDPQQTLQIQREQLDYRLDHWEIVNQSAQGFRLARSISGRRMVHAQLIALRPPGSTQFFLARSSWLMQERENGLIGGIHALPGVPQAVAARPRDVEGEGGLHAKYHPIFLLPAVAGISTEQTLILPLGWYRSGRVLDLYTDRPWQIRLLHVVDDGSDFERVSFTLC